MQESAFPLGTPLPASAIQLDRELHDAFIDLDTIDRRGTEMTISGHRVRPLQARGWRIGRFPVEICLRGVEEAVVSDPDGLRALVIMDVVEDVLVGSLTFTSAMVGSLAVTGHEVTATLTLSDKPTATRRVLGSWKAIR